MSKQQVLLSFGLLSLIGTANAGVISEAARMVAAGATACGCTLAFEKRHEIKADIAKTLKGWIESEEEQKPAAAPTSVAEQTAAVVTEIVDHVKEGLGKIKEDLKNNSKKSEGDRDRDFGRDDEM